jgi:negative regulator of flagellin synthesis FlgM
MEISDKNPLHINLYVNQVQQQRQTADATGSKPAALEKEDNVELSQTARELRRSQAALAELPDVRQEKVAQLKHQIESGTYRIEPEKIAEKMLDESLLNDLFNS